MAARLKKGDKVVIIAGRDKGRTGEIIEVRRGEDRALVRGVNIVKRHTKQGTKSSNMGGSTQTGGIIEKEAALPLSALQYLCEKCKSPTRLRRGRTADGVAHRLCARCGEPARDSGDVERHLPLPRPHVVAGDDQRRGLGEVAGLES